MMLSPDTGGTRHEEQCEHQEDKIANARLAP